MVDESEIAGSFSAVLAGFFLCLPITFIDRCQVVQDPVTVIALSYQPGECIVRLVKRYPCGRDVVFRWLNNHRLFTETQR